MVLCIEPQKIYSPGGATKLLFKERFRTTAHGLKLQVEINNGFEWGGGHWQEGRPPTGRTK